MSRPSWRRGRVPNIQRIIHTVYGPSTVLRFWTGASHSLSESLAYVLNEVNPKLLIIMAALVYFVPFHYS
jgi:hypothetical protein